MRGTLSEGGESWGVLRKPNGKDDPAAEKVVLRKFPQATHHQSSTSGILTQGKEGRREENGANKVLAYSAKESRLGEPPSLRQTKGKKKSLSNSKGEKKTKRPSKRETGGTENRRRATVKIKNGRGMDKQNKYSKKWKRDTKKKCATHRRHKNRQKEPKRGLQKKRKWRKNRQYGPSLLLLQKAIT